MPRKQNDSFEMKRRLQEEKKGKEKSWAEMILLCGVLTRSLDA
jgi:hypothetical protein